MAGPVSIIQRRRKERPTLIMKFLEMMNFVLILVIAMMSRSSLEFETKISIAFKIIFAAMAKE